jgi:VCBS repeat-containing protein
MFRDHATLAIARLISLLSPFRRLTLAVLALAVITGCSGGGGGGGSSTTSVVTEPPVANNGSVTTLEDNSVTRTLSASDPGGNTLTFRVVANPGKGAVVVSPTTGSYTFTPNLNANGSDSFTFVANNGTSDSNVATVAITITPVNDPPVANNDTYTVSGSGQTLSVTANCADPDPNKRIVLCNDTDPDGAAPTQAFIATNVSHGTITLNPNGSFTYTHNGINWDMCGSLRCDSFTYFANDGTLNSTSAATVTLIINQPPVASNACASTPVNTTKAGSLNAADPDGQTLTYTLVTQGSKGTVNIDVVGNYSYTPKDSTIRGMDKFTYRVTDPYGKTATGDVWVLIDGAVRIMPLGDSITQGINFSGSCGTSDGDCPSFGTRIGYRKKLWTDLETPPNYAVDFVGSLANGSAAGLTPPDDKHEGHPGLCAANTANPICSTYGNLIDNIQNWLSLNPPDIILLHIGTNDINNTTWPNIQASLDKIDNWESTHYPLTVFLARIIPTQDVNNDVNTLNNSVEGNLPGWLATHPNSRVIMVDQQSQLRSVGNANIADPSLMASNVHPNQTGYDKMADKWKADMQSSGVLPSCP